MEIQVSGKKIDVGDSLRSHVEGRLSGIADKYFAKSIEAHVVFSREGAGFRSDCSIHVGHGVEAQSHGEAADIYASFDAASERLEKQMRRYKRRLRNHHQQREQEDQPPAFRFSGRIFETESETEEAPEEFQPVIVAENTTDAHAMSVGDAVMRLELGKESLLMFRNQQSGALNLVHLRADGHIGWLDLSDVRNGS